jgi:hypothetical protein
MPRPDEGRHHARSRGLVERGLFLLETVEQIGESELALPHGFAQP